MKQPLLLVMVLAMVGCSEKPQIPTLKEKAEGGDAEAQSMLGFEYETKQDLKEAVKWYRKAAEQGDVDAQLALGDMYSDGRGVEKDFKGAAKWYRKAAEQGDVGSQSELGGMYSKGEGVEQDFKEAAKWYRKAAEQGYASAQWLLGIMYSKGEGVPENDVAALAWLNISQTNSAIKFKLDNEYIPKIKANIVMLKNISPEQIAKAQELSKEMIKKNPKLLKD